MTSGGESNPVASPPHTKLVIEVRIDRSHIYCKNSLELPSNGVSWLWRRRKF